MTHATVREFFVACYLTAIGALLPSCATGPGVGVKDRGVHIDVTLLDSVRCWCAPLWGHHAPKIVEGKDGEVFVALFSGEYPEASVRILKRNLSGRWFYGKTFTRAYQPSFMFVDKKGRLNVLQNSQTLSLIQYRSSDDDNLNHFETIAEGNGQSDGRGWYAGAGINGDTVYMAYILLSYDLFLTWKRVLDTNWNPAILIHKGIVDAAKGNHSWTRPRFQFAGGKGYFVVNETSDGSVKNSYNAVQLITFDLSDPRHFTTECISCVPQGFGAYSSDFSISDEGWLHCVVEKSARIYDTPFDSDEKPGVFVYSRRASGGEWMSAKVFKTEDHDASMLDMHQGSLVIRVDASKNGVETGNTVTSGRGEDWEAFRTDDHGASWKSVAAEAPPLHFSNPSHMQVVTASSGSTGNQYAQGVFQDDWGLVSGTKLSRYGVYYFRVTQVDSL